MANPQTENGYIKIANEIQDAIAHIRIPGEARQVLDFIIRKTYGYQKKEDKISFSQFIIGTGLIKQHVNRAIKTLVKMNLVTKRGYRRSIYYGLNKDFDTWKSFQKERQYPNMVTGVTKEGYYQYPNMVNTKESKETITKEISREQVAPIQNLKNLKMEKVSFKREDYIKVHDAYIQFKGIQPQGNEWNIIDKVIKEMFLAGRTVEQIELFMSWFGTVSETENEQYDWTKNWTIRTIKIKIPEFLAGKLFKWREPFEIELAKKMGLTYETNF